MGGRYEEVVKFFSEELAMKGQELDADYFEIAPEEWHDELILRVNFLSSLANLCDI
jgi:hypothetical protein